jgi:hypothetical protein
MRAAVVGGGAYMVGKHVQQGRQQEADQNAQIADLQQQQYQQAPPQQYAQPAPQYAAPAPAAAPAAGGGMADELAKLKSLLDSGALTPDEYEAAKQKVIQGG